MNDAGETLPAIIDQIRNQIEIKNGPVNEFEVQLFAAGYIDKHRIKYENRGYTDRDIHIFLVKNQFPCIVERDLKNGVGDVHYTIDLSSCVSFEVNETDFLAGFEGK
jgi:hypothetical protein